MPPGVSADSLTRIGERYTTAAKALLDAQNRIAVLDTWRKDSDDILDLLKAIALVRSAPQRSRDVVAVDPVPARVIENDAKRPLAFLPPRSGPGPDKYDPELTRFPRAA